MKMIRFKPGVKDYVFQSVTQAYSKKKKKKKKNKAQVFFSTGVEPMIFCHLVKNIIFQSKDQSQKILEVFIPKN